MATSSPRVEPDPAPAAPTPRGRPRALRLRLLLVAAVTLVVTLGIAGLVLAEVFENNIERTLEQDLETEWSELAGAFVLGTDGTPTVQRDLSDPRYRKPYGGAYWHIDENGTTLLRSRSLWDASLTPRSTRHLSPRGTAVELDGPNGSTVYALTRAVTLEGDAGPRRFDLVVALDTADIAGLRASFAADVTRFLVVIGLVLFAGAAVQVFYGLAPLAALRARLAEVHAGRTRRLEGRFPEELTPLVDDLNALLARQDDLVRRARERAGDLAHGLKTPLTILGRLERRCVEAGDREAAAILREQIAAMRDIVERQLSRARTHGQAAAGGTLTDAAATAGRLIALFRRMPRGEDLVWENGLPPDLRLRIDADDFGEVLGNLLDNARKAAASHVRLSAEPGEGTVTIRVDDDGPGIPPDQRDRLVERGVSDDATREGTGLGLAIVREVLAEYGAAPRFSVAPSGGCRISFRLPGGSVAP